MKPKVKISLFNAGCQTSVASYPDVDPNSIDGPDESTDGRPMSFVSSHGRKIATNLHWIIEDMA